MKIKSIDWSLVLIISLIVSVISIIAYLIWDEYHWRTLPDGRIYRLNHTCISSHTETYPVVQTNIDPNGNAYTTTVIQTTTVCDYELVDTVWKNK